MQNHGKYEVKISKIEVAGDYSYNLQVEDINTYIVLNSSEEEKQETDKDKEVIDKDNKDNEENINQDENIPSKEPNIKDNKVDTIDTTKNNKAEISDKNIVKTGLNNRYIIIIITIMAITCIILYFRYKKYSKY